MTTLQQLSKKFDWVYCNSTDFPGIAELLDFLLIILPSWSPKDLSILELIAGELEKYNVPVYVIDIDQFSTQQEISHMFPGLPGISQTPIVAIYKDGGLQICEQGEEVKKIKH